MFSQAQRVLYVLAHEILYVYIIDRIWNKISSTFGGCSHCGHQSVESGCAVDHKVFLICLASPQDAYEPMARLMGTFSVQMVMRGRFYCVRVQ